MGNCIARAWSKAGARTVLAAALLVVAGPGQTPAQLRTEVHWGEATDDAGKLLYRERHEVGYEDGRVRSSLTSYRDLADREFATLASDYRLSVTMPTYLFADSRRGHREGLRLENGRYVIFHEEAGKAEKTKVLADDTNVYSCQGWHYYLVSNLLQVAQGEALEVRLLFPNRLKPYTFKILRQRADGDLLRIKVRISNWLLNLVAPHLEVVYDQQAGKLVEYHGVSNIVDAKGELQNVHITYQY